MLPFLQGLIFFGEPITVAKTVCFSLICISLVVVLEKGEKKKGGLPFYIAIFVLNGMAGVYSKIFVSAPFEKTSPAGYSILIACWTVIISSLCLFLFYRKRQADDNTPPMTLISTSVSGISGAANQIANFLLTIALAFVDASVQYPMVTGGVIIVSTIAAFFVGNKPSKKELLSVGIAFVGLLAMFFIPV